VAPAVKIPGSKILGRRPRAPKKLVTEASQTFTFNRRAFFLGSAQLGVGGLLVGRMGWIAIAENEKYRLLSESNRVNLTIIPPRRGWLIDRGGKPLASNRTDFRVDIIKDRLQDRERVMKELTSLLQLEPNDVDRINEDLDKAAGFQPVQVADDLTYEQFAAVSVRLADLPGVAPAQGYSRFYPAGPSVGHLIGYVGAASAEDYQKSKDPLLITPGYKTGKEGLEKSLDAQLTGKPGARRVEVTAHGRIVRDLATRPDIPGKPVRLTIDAGLQEFAGRRLGTQSGSIVIIDCHSGDVLASASMPSYDPNSFSDGISHLEYEMLNQDEHLPLRNKTLQGLYPPGSTVKPMIGLALLKAGIDPEATVGCSGSIRVGNAIFHCWKRGGHGGVNLHRAIEQSCDVYFYQMAQRIGMDPIAAMAHKLGLGERFALPFPSQSFGTVPTTAWKLKKYGTKWEAYDTVNATIGQGYMLINPTQLAVMASRLASGRQLVPHYLAGNGHGGAPLDVTPEHLALVHEAMRDVVNGAGTGHAARLTVPDVLMAGKTGTAQVRRITMAERAGGVRSNGSLPFKLRDHALFQGFAPYDNPRYAIGVVLEHGGHVSYTQDSPMIAGDCITYLYDPAKALEKLDGLEKTWGGTPQERLERQLNDYRISKGLAALPSEANEAANVTQGNAATAPAEAVDGDPETAPEPPIAIDAAHPAPPAKPTEAPR
jgi:penicillin-binding protein 2